MDRRTFLTAFSATVALPFMRPAPAAGEDVEYLLALERAQRDRPPVPGSSGRIAPATEPGTPLVIHGRVFQRDGRTPAPGVVIFAYHTDATGHYDVPSAGPHSWRLRGWARSAADGRFEFATIRPAPYPSGRAAAHVHLLLEAPGAPRQDAGLLFEGDPLISASERDASAAAGLFGSVRAVEERGGVEHVTLNIRIGGEGR